MKLVKCFLLAIINFISNIHASNEESTDMEQKCPSPQHKGLKQEERETTRFECDTSLSNWLKSIEDINFAAWEQYDENDQPFDRDSPKIELNIPFLKRKFEFNMTDVFIKTQTGDILFEGKMIFYKLVLKSTSLIIDK